jgi:hypothetical protein
MKDLELSYNSPSASKQESSLMMTKLSILGSGRKYGVKSTEDKVKQNKRIIKPKSKKSTRMYNLPYNLQLLIGSLQVKIRVAVMK